MNAGNNQYQNMIGQLVTFFNSYLIPTLLTIAAGVFLVLGIINGIRMAKASTDEEKTKAKKALIGQLLGMVVCVVSIWLAPLLMNFLMTVFSGNGLDAIEPK
ncbi:MAG: hypothetical protein J6A83_09055 [Clostridia bacterium]|nr:hypothetical protein [Clostridia bacterium]